MPRYFFHVRLISGPVVPDRIGIEFHDLTAARADAAEAVRQTIAEKKATGEQHDFAALEIADRTGHILSAIEFGDDPPPGSVKPTRQ
jgi:hypothetical protein